MFLKYNSVSKGYDHIFIQDVELLDILAFQESTDRYIICAEICLRKRGRFVVKGGDFFFQ